MPFDLMTAFRLSKEGMGTPTEILAMPTDIVLAAAEFSGFVADYRDTVEELNKTDG